MRLLGNLIHGLADAVETIVRSAEEFFDEWKNR